jgi:hypothetical protein
MKPVVGAIHELPLPQAKEIETIAYHICIQQRPKIIYSNLKSFLGTQKNHDLIFQDFS